MKIYEIGLPDHYDDESNDGCDCTLWIASNVKITKNSVSQNDKAYVSETDLKIEQVPEGAIDFFVTNEKA